MKNSMTAFRPQGFAPEAGIGPASADAVEEAGMLRVYKTWKKDGTVTAQENGQEVIAVRRFLTEPAKVGATISRTINTGNYESLKIEASVYLPCYAEEAEEVIGEASAIVGRFITQEEVSIRSFLNLPQVFELPETPDE